MNFDRPKSYEVLVLLFAAYLKGLSLSGIKWVSGFPTNVPKRLPTIVGTLVLNDCETGELATHE